VRHHQPRTPAKPGFSIVDANPGRLITYQEDVLGVKREIECRWAGLLSVFFDTDMEVWVIVEHCSDGTDRVAFTTEALSQATIDKIHRCDQDSRSFEDPETAYQKADKEEERQKDWNLSERVGEAAERLYHGLRKDGLIHRPQVFFSE
jgi:hypothetical protein